MGRLKFLQKKYSLLQKKTILFGLLFFCFQITKAQISTFPYLEDFEAGPAWTAFTAPTSTNAASSDWAWGTPNHTYVIKSAGSGSKCWCAGGLTGAFYKNWEQSYVVSPVFNFTNLLYPHIKFKLFYDSEYKFDGGNLQYSLNGGTTWTDVGTVGGTATTPIIEPNDCNTQNWYNYPSITYLNNPAGFVTSKHGWCGNTQAGGAGWDPASPATTCVGGHGPGQWITAEHCLTGCAGQASVLLRFTFASGFTCNNFDGFAFDWVNVSNGIPNAANFTSACGAGNVMNFTSTFAPCPQTNAWLWNFGDPSSGATNTITTQNASHTFSAPGTYTVVLIAKGGACNPPDTVTNIVQIMSSSITSQTNVNCFGGNNGSAVAIVSSGNSPFSYSWSPTGGSTTTATALTAGNYTFTVTDANGCQKTSSVNITQPPIIVASVTSTNVTCNGMANGLAVLTASGGVAPLSYSWSPAGGSSLTASGLNIGSYTATVTDGNLCTKTATFTINEPTAISASVSSTNPLCTAPGSATITASGGTGALSYSWSPSGGTSNVASGLSGGNYSVTVTDANSCSKTLTVTLSQPGSYTTSMSSTSVSCFGGNNGTATAMITGTSTPYSYTWSPTGGFNSTANTLTAGNYTVTISDVNGCIQTKTVAITQPTVITVSGTSNSITCNGLANGSATVIASGGVAPLSYSWSPSGGSSSSASGLGVGNYTTTVSDANSCTKTVTFAIIQPAAINGSVTSVDALCGNPGSATITASGGTGALSYSWSPAGGTGNVATGLTGGIYSVTITDMNSCIKTITLNLLSSTGFTTAVTHTNVSCFGGNNGIASVTVSGTSSPYSYTWSPSGGSNSIANGLAAGNYTVNISDVNGCIQTKTVAITQPTVITVSGTSNSVTCNGLSNGSATVIAAGGVGPLNYSWSPSGGNSASSSGLGVGIYTTTVTDQNLCTKTITFSIIQPSSISTTVATTNPRCLNLGSATITATGGTGALSYSWLPSGGSGTTANSLSSGNYSVITTDMNGCTNTSTFTLLAYINFTATITSASVSCFGGSNGSAVAVITGSTSPYTYSWLPTGGSNSTANGLTAGNYSVTISDVNGCNSTTTVSIIQPAALSIAISNATICNGQQATITPTVTGGTSPYTYQWSPSGSNTISISITPTVTTSYTFNVTDNNNCNAAPVISTVNVSPPLSVIANGPFTMCSGTTASLIATASGGNGNYQYLWIPGNITGSQIHPVVTANTQYTVIVSDGCTVLPAQALTQINVIISPTINIQSSNISGCPTLCSNFYDSALLATGSISTWNWTFSDGQTSNTPNASVCFSKPGIYSGTLTVVTINGCQSTPGVVSNITVYNVPSPDFTSTTFDGNMFDSPFILTNTSLNYNTIKWVTTFGNYTSSSVSLNYENEGQYPVTLIATNNFGCKDSITKIIKVEPIFTFYAPNTFTPNSDNINETFFPLGIGWNEDTYKLYIFDRWGELIYTSNDVRKGWDGKAKKGNEIAEQDVYTWKVELDDIFKNHHSYIGHITLLK